MAECSQPAFTPFDHRFLAVTAPLEPAAKGRFLPFKQHPTCQRTNFPAPPGPPKDKDAYLRFIDEIYQSDAYHSLSIEGYSVTPALIDRVRGGGWDPEHHEDDRKSRDALAARGYWQTFQKVKATVAEVIAGANSGVPSISWASSLMS